MKKVLSLLFLAMMGGSALAGDKPVITVADVQALPGQTVSFAVNLTDGKADTYTAMTLYAYFPKTGFETTGDYNVASAWKSVSCTVGDIDPGTGLATIPFASSNKIPGSAVENLVTVDFKVKDDCPLGVYEVQLKGTMFEYNLSDKDYADDVTFKVTVTDRLTLDETATVAPAAATGINVKVKRSIKAGEWSTICLPFAMNKSQADAAFGSGYVVKQYTGYTATIDESTLIPSAITVNFAEYTLSALKKMQPGTPYLIKTTKDIESFDVDGVNISTDLNDVSGAETNYDLPGKFKGVLAKSTVPNNGLFISDNKFYYSTGNTNIKAFRGWFELQAVLNVPAGAPVFMNIDGETTGIENIQRTAGDDRYYNLNGQHVENLKKGQIYIKNNKKVVVK